MEVIWRKRITANNAWEPNFFGFFYKNPDHTLFFYKDCQRLCALSETPSDAITIYSGSLPLPYDWVFAEQGTERYLLLDKYVAVDLTRCSMIADSPSLVCTLFEQYWKPAIYYVEASFSFGDYCISHKGQCGYICRKNGVPIWSFSGKAYLYTDIVRWHNRVFFGTGGSGGYFYVLDIDSGAVIASIKTGGTRNFVHTDNKCYILANNKPAQVLCVDLQTGDIVQQCPLQGKSTINSRIMMIENHLHTVTFAYDKGKLKHGIWSCIKLASAIYDLIVEAKE